MIRSESLGAVLVAAGVCFVIGGLWFSPLLFGQAWLEELRVTGEPSRALGALLAVPASLLGAFGLGVIVASAHITDVPKALTLAILVWVCFVAGLELPALSLERSPRRFAIGAGHKLVVLAAMATVFELWN